MYCSLGSHRWSYQFEHFQKGTKICIKLANRDFICNLEDDKQLYKFNYVAPNQNMENIVTLGNIIRKYTTTPGAFRKLSSED